MLILFVAVQLVTGLGALLFSNLDKLGTGYPIDQLTVSPMATGISMLVGEGLLALGLWLWFFRFEKGVRAKSIERPELLGIFKFHKLKCGARQADLVASVVGHFGRADDGHSPVAGPHDPRHEQRC